MRAYNPRYNIFQNTAYVLKYAWLNRRRLILICLVDIAAALLLPIVTLYLPRTILSELEASVHPWSLVLTVLGFTAAISVLTVVDQWMQRMMECYGLELRTKQCRVSEQKSFVADYEWFDSTDFKQSQERAMEAGSNDTSALEQIPLTLVVLCTGVLGFTAYLAILLHLGWWIAPLIAICTIITSVLRVRANQKRAKGREEWAKYDKKLSYIYEKSTSAQAAKDIRLFGIADWFQDVFSSQLRLFADWEWRMSRGLLAADLVDCVFTLLREGIAYYILIGMVLSKAISVPDFVLYFTAVSGFSTWIQNIFGKCTELHRFSADISEYRRHVEHPDVFLHGTGIVADPLKPGEIRLDHVSYRYPGAETDTLHNFSLTIRAGERLAVVGLNGAGKTTLVKLICGLIDPTEGTVTYNGVDVRSFDRDSYYRLFSAVFQSFCILPLTIGENIACEPFQSEKVWDCLRKAGLEEKIRSLPNGLDSFLVREVHDDAVQLSGGETQRLMLARALYKDAPVILLDEPTAALDSIAENALYRKYSELTDGKTSVYISHRLASTRFCDRVLYMEQGEILEQGSHENLMAMGGAYYRLYEIQSQYYREEVRHEAEA